MAKVKTVVTTSGETAIQLDDHYSYAWIRNIGSGDCYVSVSPDIVAGADDVLSLKAGSIVRLTTKADVVYVKGATTVEVYAQNFSDCPFEKFGGEAGEIVIEPLSVTENGTYTATGGVDGYSPISVTVPQTTVQSLSVTENGTYTAPTGTAYSPVTVDVVEQPWEPLEDGYSNFWFELSDDTLSPWLNFSAKNADATIDWGDGSGEQSLDTLTPTHTYSKAGKYVVKVKGVTGIGRQFPTPINVPYMSVLKAVELNNEVTNILQHGFRYNVYLKNVAMGAVTSTGSNIFDGCAVLQYVNISSLASISAACFNYCVSLPNIEFSQSLTTIGNNAFSGCAGLSSVTFPSSVTSIGTSSFFNCSSLTEIHCLATTPPTLSTTPFSYLPTNWICYVPVGTGDTYKAAAGWSAYSDHIVEEGRSLSKAQLRRIAENEKKDEESR